MRKGALKILVRTLERAALIVAAASLQSSAVVADESAKPTATIDGRFNSNCLSQNAYTDEPVCMVPFPRLIAEPERFDGKYILIVGFYADFHGIPTLFPGTESFKHGLPLESIYVGKIPPELRASLKEGVWVVVVGKFDAKFSYPLSLGAIWQPLDISPLERGNKLERLPLPPFIEPKPPAAVLPPLK